MHLITEEIVKQIETQINGEQKKKFTSTLRL